MNDMDRDSLSRAQALLARMTLTEKIGQLFQGNARDEANVETWVRDWACGSLLQASGEAMIRLQKIASEETRLGIPLLFGIDAIHGHNQWKGATVFPSPLTLACSWAPALAEGMAAVAAREMRYTGAHWTFCPAAELIRDPRWGRCDEAFGEDPLLAADFVTASVRGYQGKNLSDPDSVLACVKHFAGYCETEGGRDAAEAHLTRRRLLSLFLPPFEAAVRAGVATVMIGYNAIDGVPCNIHRWLLTDLLVGQWGFEGFTVSDWGNVNALVARQGVCRDLREASVKSLEAGMHMCMATPGFVDAIRQAVEEGAVSQETVDAAVRRILTLKFKLGLFDGKRYPDLGAGKKVWACADHRALCLRAARQSLVLLKNEGNFLPLDGRLRKVALFGANADDDFAQLGDWSRVGSNSHERHAGPTGSGHPRENIATVRDALRLRSDLETDYVRACGPLDEANDSAEFERAVAAAARADVALVVLGDVRSMMGEGFDRAHTGLPGNQQALLERLQATGTPVVLVLMASKPLSIGWATDHVPAIVAAFNPGMLGGQAVCDALFGDANFEGKLCVSFPRCAGQAPVAYNQLPGWHGDHPLDLGYADERPGPLFAFGYGLSYTSFQMDGVELSAQTLRRDDTLTVRARVTNTGARAGVEVVQVYVNDRVSSLTTPAKELKGYARVALAANASETVAIPIPVRSLAFIGEDLRPIVEPGEFEIMVGASSRDEDLVRLVVEVVE